MRKGARRMHGCYSHAILVNKKNITWRYAYRNYFLKAK
jgi:hypothetical protein